MLALVQSGERHVMVCEGSTLVGIVSEHDLYRLSRLDMKEMLQRLSRCDSTAALSGVAATFRRQVVALFKQGMDADASTRLLSLFNDQLLARLCQLHLGEAGLDEVEICWLQFGSSGRQENTLTSDQDSGIVFHSSSRCAAPAGPATAAIAQRICSALSACGIPLCRNGVMAGNPSHCLSLEDWSDTFISQLMQSPDTAGHIGLYLDMRPAWGSMAGLELASALRQRATDRPYCRHSAAMPAAISHRWAGAAACKPMKMTSWT
jgi:CBS domain-containing protein